MKSVSFDFDPSVQNSMKHPSAPTPPLIRPGLLILGILLIAANLRAPITGVAPLLDNIRDSFGLSTAAAGMLTTLPLLAFAAVSPLAARWARRYGLERTLFVALLLIAVGILARSAGNSSALFIGTWIIGSGIAIGNVLLPSLLKRDFPGRVTSLTSVYALTMGAVAALSSMMAIPLAKFSGLGWPFALGALAILPMVSALVWLPQLYARTAPAESTATAATSGPLWRSAIAWQITLFLGLNSLVYYVIISWLPLILHEAGYTPSQAGNIHGLMQLASAIAGLLVVPMVARLKDQRLTALCSALLLLVGILGLQFAPNWALIWSLVLGLGSGAVIILGLAFTSLRVRTPEQAAALSGMAQAVGYLLAAAGPVLAGKLHDAMHNWQGVLSVAAVMSLVIAVCGMLAGRNAYIETPASAK